MPNHKPYDRRFNVLPAWTLKAVGLVLVGAIVSVIALTIARAVSAGPDSALGGKVVGVRHEATALTGAADTQPDVSTTGSGEQPALAAPTTEVRNGLTVVSPKLRVAAIDLGALQGATASEDTDSSARHSYARKRSRYAKASNAHGRAKRWTAYGLAIR